MYQPNRMEYSSYVLAAYRTPWRVEPYLEVESMSARIGAIAAAVWATVGRRPKVPRDTPRRPQQHAAKRGLQRFSIPSEIAAPVRSSAAPSRRKPSTTSSE